MIANAPTGISWNIIPFPKSSTAEQYAEQLNICWRATGIVDAYCNQVLRATVDNETLSGPGNFRVNMQQATGNVRAIMSRWPVTGILAVQTCSNAVFPRQWTNVPSGMYDIEHPTIGIYGTSSPSAAGDGGQSILVAPGYMSWGLGREGYRLAVSYVNGWPHTALTAAATTGDTTLTVDDVTGFTGAAAFVYDGANTETVVANATDASTPLVLPNSGGTAQAGPGTLSLASPLTAGHSIGTVVSSLPQDILWAAVLASATQALESGITAIAIQNLPGSMTTGGHGVSDLELQYQQLLKPYRRVI